MLGNTYTIISSIKGVVKRFLIFTVSIAFTNFFTFHNDYKSFFKVVIYSSDRNLKIGWDLILFIITSSCFSLNITS